jgi:hypothetical protein
LHIKQFHVVEGLDRRQPLTEPGQQAGHLAAERLDALGAHPLIGALGDEIGDLEVVAAVDQCAAVAGPEDAGQPVRIGVVAR